MLGCKLLVIAAVCVATIWGHGMVMDPINRSSIWRTHPGLPINYDDTEMFCGGFGIQWLVNDGKCGLCGDDYRNARPRANENTGKYGQAAIAKEYQSGSVITAKVLITANHWGYFNFSICELPDSTKMEAEDCFQQIKIADGKDSYELPSHEKGIFNVDIQLPAGLKCEHCVLKWHWHTANTWGDCEDGTGGMGCGPQEEFMSCSDIAIV